MIHRTLFRSLRGRMALGGLLMAVPAVVAALAMMYMAGETSQRLEDSAAAEARIELYGHLSGRISEYAVMAVEASGVPKASRAEVLPRLESKRGQVMAAFGDISSALGRFVESAEGEFETNQRATRSLRLARMRAQFHQLTQAIEHGQPQDMRPRLDGFATRFSPLMDAAINEEHRDRRTNIAAIESLRTTHLWIATAIIALVGIVLAGFYLGLIRPLMRRLEEGGETALGITDPRSPALAKTLHRDELGLMLTHVHLALSRLDRRRLAVQQERQRLNELVVERTAELRAANAALENIDANRRRFFSDVSHELRTPLTAILSEADVALRNPDTHAEDFRASLSVVRNRAQRLHRRVDDLLRIARSDTGRIELQEQSFDLRNAAREAVDDMSVQIARRGIELKLQLADAMPTFGDYDWSRQVISGVIDNAVRLSPHRGTIRVIGQTTRTDAQIIIMDEGPGIDPDDRLRVFERFERGIQSQDKGFGVGLALAHWVMTQQGGTISIENVASSSSGAVVILSMPMLTEVETE